MSKKRVTRPVQAVAPVVIQHCEFHSEASVDVLAALRAALDANVAALRAVTERLPSLVINPPEKK